MRTKKAKTRIIEADPLYHSVVVQKLINRIMKDGKKTIAQKHVYATFDALKAKTSQNPLEVFDTALNNIMPKIEVRSRRVGGAAYQVPTPVRTHRGHSLALRWLVNEASKRPNSEYKTFAQKLTAEILDAVENQGGAIQKKLTAHKMAEANKAFAHFRW